jgi:sirohydrochlorin cobaltochelatase
MSISYIILGHGSRAPGASAGMERIAARLAERLSGCPVRVAHMELCPPGLGETIASCAAAGAREVVVVPYFLHHGNHLREDIPALLRQALAAHPGLVIRCGPPLGYDEAMVDLVQRRCADAASAGPLEP